MQAHLHPAPQDLTHERSPENGTKKGREMGDAVVLGGFVALDEIELRLRQPPSLRGLGADCVDAVVHFEEAGLQIAVGLKEVPGEVVASVKRGTGKGTSTEA